jgi:integrase/recombinase XerC
MVNQEKNKYQSHNLIEKIDQFSTYLEVEKLYAFNTISAYRRDLSKFMSFCLENSVNEWQDVEADTLNLFVMGLRHRGVSARSIRRYLSSIRGFFTFLVQQGILAENCVTSIQTPKIDQVLPKIIDFDDLKRMTTLSSELYPELRAVVMIELMYSCGLRVSELVGIDINDLDLEEGFVRVKGKGGKTRFSPIGRSAIDAVEMYLSRRPNCENDALFVNQNNHRISPRSVQNIVKKRALEVGVTVNVHPHMLRHAAATHFLQSSHDLRTVQEFLGHKSIKSTQVYTHLDFLELSKVYDEFHPRAKK